MTKKYELIESTAIHFQGKNLYRIKALKNFGEITIGKIGGYIESEDNLSHEGNAWVGGHAHVLGNAKIYENAQVLHYAIITDNAEIFGNAEVTGRALIGGQAKIFDHATIRGGAFIYDQVQIFGNTEISENITFNQHAKIYGNAKVLGNTVISGQAEVYGQAYISGDIHLFGTAKIFGNACLSNKLSIQGNVELYGNIFLGNEDHKIVFNTPKDFMLITSIHDTNDALLIYQIDSQLQFICKNFSYEEVYGDGGREASNLCLFNDSESAFLRLLDRAYKKNDHLWQRDESDIQKYLVIIELAKYYIQNKPLSPKTIDALQHYPELANFCHNQIS